MRVPQPQRVQLRAPAPIGDEFAQAERQHPALRQVELHLVLVEALGPLHVEAIDLELHLARSTHRRGVERCVDETSELGRRPRTAILPGGPWSGTRAPPPFGACPRGATAGPDLAGDADPVYHQT